MRVGESAGIVFLIIDRIDVLYKMRDTKFTLRRNRRLPVALAAPGGMAPNPDFVAVVQAVFAKDSKLVLGCQSGGRSQRAVAALEGAGYTNIVEQRAGWGGARDAFGRVLDAGWQAEGLPAESGPDKERGYSALKDRK